MKKRVRTYIDTILKRRTFVLSSMGVLVLTTILSLTYSAYIQKNINAPTSASVAQKKEIEAIIQNYFLENPQQLASSLENMQNFLAQEKINQQAQLLVDKANIFYRNKRDVSIGPKDAAITIVEYFDYNCGYCKRVLDPLLRVLDTHKDVRLVLKEYPILSDSSRLAAKYALAIKDPDKYIAFHTSLMNNRYPLNDEVLHSLLRSAGLDVADIVKRSRNSDIQAHIGETHHYAGKLGLQGTPAFIINGEIYPGALNRAEFEDAIARARKALKKDS